MSERRAVSSRRAFRVHRRRFGVRVAFRGPSRATRPPRCARRPWEGTARTGISKWELDTPALCVDLDKMEENVAKMQATLKKNGIASRPHAKTHKCAAIAKHQLATGSIGICCAKVSEAEALFEHGVRPLLMTTSNPTPSKIRRAMKLRKANSSFIQAVDEEQNARDLSAAAKEAGVVADVVIDVAVGTRTGIPPGDGAVALAKLVDTLPGLKLRGMLSYDGGVQHVKGFAERKARALKTIEANATTLEGMKKAGLNVEIFSGGGTGTYNVMHLVPGFSDVQVGSYVFMDMAVPSRSEARTATTSTRTSRRA